MRIVTDGKHYAIQRGWWIFKQYRELNCNRWSSVRSVNEFPSLFLGRKELVESKVHLFEFHPVKE